MVRTVVLELVIGVSGLPAAGHDEVAVCDRVVLGGVGVVVGGGRDAYPPR
jgi:hypothetical protein